MNKKGFTLIELLSVIILLGVVAVISVPVVRDITKDAKQKSFEKQKNTVLESAKNWAIKNTDLLPDDNSSILVKMDTLKKEGLLENKKVINPVDNKEMNGCAEISYNEQYNQYEYTYTECENLKNIINSTDNDCVISGVCTASEIKGGIKVNVQVNDNDNYDFYVIKDTGSELSLIMDRNLINDVSWINKANYASSNTDNTSCDYEACSDEGPITALNALEAATSDWINIETFDYTLEDDNSTTVYQSLERQNVRARMLTYTEAFRLGCSQYGVCPKWLYANLDLDSVYAYWLTTTYDEDSAWILSYQGKFYVGQDSLANPARVFKTKYTVRNGEDQYLEYGSYGVRPVIKISKTPIIY